MKLFVLFLCMVYVGYSAASKAMMKKAIGMICEGLDMETCQDRAETCFDIISLLNSEESMEICAKTSNFTPFNHFKAILEMMEDEDLSKKTFPDEPMPKEMMDFNKCMAQETYGLMPGTELSRDHLKKIIIAKTGGTMAKYPSLKGAMGSALDNCPLPTLEDATTFCLCVSKICINNIKLDD